jgi:hypothetical protein
MGGDYASSGRIKIRCYDMGGGYATCERIKINLG